jgi:hypothetical protein
MTVHVFGQPNVYRINEYLLFRDKWQFAPEITKIKEHKKSLTRRNFIPVDEKVKI